MSRKPWVAYYAMAPHAELPEGGLAEMSSRIRSTSTRVLVVDARWAAPQRPALAPLLDRASHRSALIFAIDRPHALRLYRVPPFEFGR